MQTNTDILLAALLLVFAVTVGLLLDALGWTLFAAAMTWIVLERREFRKIYQWAQRPLKRPDNSRDRWFALAYPPFRALKRERQRSRQMATQLREILGLAEVIPDGVIILSPQGDIEGMNTAAKKLLQLTEADMGLGLATVVRSPDFVAFIRSEEQDAPLDFISPFNPDQSFEARRFDAGTGRTIVLVRDITTLNRLLTMRQNFVANVSHELRTPLTVVAGYLETIRDVDQPEALRLSLVEKLDSPIKRMQSLVDDLMLLTQLESTPITDQKDILRLGHIVDAAVSELGPLSAEAQITKRIETDAPILGIETELHSVCVNLISNALRYSPEGEPIEISLQDHGNKIRLTVKDRGYGIAPEHLDRLTERFYRVDLAGASTRGGTGLGLAIVKHVLRRHDSELHIKSTLGGGSTFYCDFDRATESE